MRTRSDFGLPEEELATEDTEGTEEDAEGEAFRIPSEVRRSFVLLSSSKSLSVFSVSSVANSSLLQSEARNPKLRSACWRSRAAATASVARAKTAKRLSP